MSRQPEPPSSALPGASALPAPRVDTGWIRACARRLADQATAIEQTSVSTGTFRSALDRAWTAEAAAAAGDEADTIGRRVRTMASALRTTSAALTTYAGRIEQLVADIHALQRLWDQARATDPSAAQPSPTVQSTLVQLSVRYRARKDEVDAAGLALARTVASATDQVAPGAAGRQDWEVRQILVAGLPSLQDAESVQRLTERTRLAADAFSSLGRTPEEGQSARFLSEYGTLLLDPDAAAAFVQQVGADRLLQQVWDAYANPGRNRTVRDDELIALIGTALLGAGSLGSSNRPGDSLSLRAWRQQRASELAAQLYGTASTRFADADGGHHASGYWLTSQAFVAARRSGSVRRLDAGFLARLLQGAAQAEFAQTRDADQFLVNGTTLRGGRPGFVAMFEDVPHSGDALHVLLAEVGQSREAAARALGTTLATTLPDRRGRQITLAAYLVRRFVTQGNLTPGSDPDLHLATQDDLRHLMSLVTTGPTAEQDRAWLTVLQEIGRVSEDSSITLSESVLYEQNVGDLETDSVRPFDHLLRVGPGPSQDAQGNRAHARQELLNRVEQILVARAYARDAESPFGSADPAQNAEDLLALQWQELDSAVDAAVHSPSARDRVWPFVRASEAADRIVFLERGASSALLDRAFQADHSNEATLRILMETAAALRRLRSGPTGIFQGIADVSGDGTLLDADDRAVIAHLRTDLQVEQALTNEEREKAALDRLREQLARAGMSPRNIEVLLGRAIGLAPRVDSAEEVKDRRYRAEMDSLLYAKDIGDGEDNPLPDLGIVRTNPGAPPTGPSAPGRGSVADLRMDTKKNRSSETAHEDSVAQFLAERGHHVTLLPESRVDLVKTPDAVVDGELVEFKTSDQASRRSINKRIADARHQAHNVLLDLRTTEGDHRDLVSQELASHAGTTLNVLWVLTSGGQIECWRPGDSSPTIVDALRVP